MTPKPYYVAPGESRVTRRILLVSPAFPPCAEVGALRWEKITILAARAGWGVDVITGAASPRDRMDDSRLLNLPPGTRVWSIPMPVLAMQKLDKQLAAMLAPIRKRRRAKAGRGEGDRDSGASNVLVAPPPTSTPSAAPSLLRNVRAWSFFAAWNAWGDEVLALARSIARESKSSVVASSGPPHMSHVAAQRVSEALELPLVIDLRDPWNVAEAEPRDLRGSVWKREVATYERSACDHASLIVLNTDSSADLIRTRYPQVGDRIITVMNGADADVKEFAGSGSDTFDIVHAGSLYSGRDPRALLRAVRQFFDAVPSAIPHVRVVFIGQDTYEGVPLGKIARECGIDEVFNSRGPIPRREALQLSGNASINVVLPQDWSHSIPSKLFEYVQFPAWILALSQPTDAITQFLRGTSSPALTPGDTAGIAQFIAERFAQWNSGRLATGKGKRAEPLNADGHYDREGQVERLLAAMDRIV